MPANDRDRFTPGTICKQSGIWRVYDTTGHDTGTERTIVSGEPYPPIPAGYTYGSVDAAQTAWNDQEPDAQPREKGTTMSKPRSSTPARMLYEAEVRRIQAEIQTLLAGGLTAAERTRMTELASELQAATAAYAAAAP